MCMNVDSLFFLSFKQGLKTLGVLEKIQTYPEAFCNIFCHKPESLSAKILSDLFTVHTLSDVQALGFWNSYLQAIEGMWIFYFYLTGLEILFWDISLFEICIYGKTLIYYLFVLIYKTFFKTSLYD